MSERDWQHQVAAFMCRHELEHSATTHMLDLVSEVGELAKELLLATDYGREPLKSSGAILEELGDTLYSLLAVAETCGLNAGDALGLALEKYEIRLNFHDRAGSQ